jgi:hypothetical protein
MTLAVVPSFMGPNSSALETADRAASTHRCATTVSAPTWNVTSAPSLDRRRLPMCFWMSGGGKTTEADGAAGGGTTTAADGTASPTAMFSVMETLHLMVKL